MKKKNFLLDKFQREGYSSIPDFINRSGVPLVFETIRYAIYEGKYKDVNPDSLMKMMYYLNFTPNEIRDKMEELGYLPYSRLIGGQEVQLKLWEKTLLSLFNKFREQEDYDTWNSMIESLRIYAKIFRVDIDEEITMLTMNKKKE